MTPEQLWEKYSILYYSDTRIIDEGGFLAALAEYGDAVRTEAVKEKPIDPNKWAFDQGLESY